MNLQLIDKMAPMFDPYRYKILYGGRGGLKSWSIAQILLVIGTQKDLRVLCAREFQTSLTQSVFQLLCDQISKLGLLYNRERPKKQHYQITKNKIFNGMGTSFTFAGLHHNIDNIKSMESIDVCWVEEANTVSEHSWSKLIPTLRKPGSEIWISFNPENEDDPTYQRFVVNTPPRAFVLKTSWADNPWLSQEMIEEKDYLKRVDYDSYLYVWEGMFLKRSKAQIFWDKVRIDYVKPDRDWAGPYYGVDWGFSNDPLRMIKCWIHDRKLYIQKEVNGIGVDIDKIPKLLLDGDPDCYKYSMRGDSARPEIISYLRKTGFQKLVPCKKGAGSVEAGITFIRSFEEIVIDPSCVNTIEEAKMYKYKVDRLTDEVLPDIVDDFNHSWDAIRYALEPLMPQNGKGTVRVSR